MFRPLALALLLAPLPAAAEVRALLVGVSDYHRLDADLRGPANDVGLIAAALIARGADPGLIRVLTTPTATLPAGVAAPADPTRAAILAALAALAAEAESGDSVVFYFSGHGSQAPDLSGDEGGGHDEIFLPSDAGRWKGAVGAVENALTDDELQQAMQAILASGAELVAILDACHSATGFRAAGGSGVARYLAPETLGVPGSAPAGAAADAPALDGRFAFLYSAQSDERAFEYPVGDPADPTLWYGDFTRALAGVLTATPDLSWRQALAAATDALRRSDSTQTPDGEGPGLDAPVFGSAAAGSGRFRLADGRLRAGLLDGLDLGATVELFDRAAGGTSLGLATVAALSATEGRLDAATLPAAAWAEPVAPGLPPPLALAPTVAADAADPAAALTTLAALRDADAVEGLVWDAAPAEAGLVLAGGDLILVGRDGQVDPEGPGSSPRIAADAPPDAVAAFLDRAVRVARLRLALARAGERPALGTGAGLTVAASRHPATPDCTATLAPEPLADAAPVGDCDEIWLALTNTSRTARDVTVFYIDRDLTVTALWPVGGLSNRVGLGETVEVGLRIELPGGRAGGVEEIVVVAVPARDGAPRTVLTGLADPAASRGPGAPADGIGAWLAAAADPGTTARGFSARVDRVAVTRLRVTLAPRTNL